MGKAVDSTIQVRITHLFNLIVDYRRLINRPDELLSTITPEIPWIEHIPNELLLAFVDIMVLARYRGISQRGPEFKPHFSMVLAIQRYIDVVGGDTRLASHDSYQRAERAGRYNAMLTPSADNNQNDAHWEMTLPVRKPRIGLAKRHTLEVLW